METGALKVALHPGAFSDSGYFLVEAEKLNVRLMVPRVDPEDLSQHLWRPTRLLAVWHRSYVTYVTVI